MKKLKKVLIANRGEIALRLIRACEELGLESVAVFSKADRMAPHVHAAHEAYCIGPPPALESYLRVDKLIEVARGAGCDSAAKRARRRSGRHSSADVRARPYMIVDAINCTQSDVMEVLEDRRVPQGGTAVPPDQARPLGGLPPVTGRRGLHA